MGEPMSLVVAFDEIKPDQVRRNKGGPDSPASTTFPFFRATMETPDAPSAFLARYNPDDRSCAHYHAVDQFQILVAGKGTLGRHEVSPYYVHFARAYTPYGPLHADKDTGWTFMTLRTRYDAGAQRLPGALAKLTQVPDRRPWQITSHVTFPARGSGASLQEIPGIVDDRGLFTCALTVAPGMRAVAPAPSGGAGQFVVVVKGSLLYDGRERQALTVAFVKPDEDAFRIHAGPQGLEALILNFPRAAPRTADGNAPPTAAGFRKWQCVLCAFSYDEALGIPEEGIPAGTRWADVPDTWTCADCGAGKSDFEMVEV
jgi:rubredoxin